MTTTTQVEGAQTKDTKTHTLSLTAEGVKVHYADQLRSRIQKGKECSLETDRGTLYITKQHRSKDKRFRALVAFVPRASLFDLGNTASRNDEFRGFFTLFWISIFLLTIRTYVISFEETGQPLALGFAAMFSRHAIALALSDAALVASTIIFCVPFSKALTNGLLEYGALALSIQHTFQITLLVTAVAWTFNQNWPWVQSGFLTLHAFVMIMKVHSYLSHNGNLSRTAMEAKKMKEALIKVTDSVGGWSQAIQDAICHRQAASHDTTSTASSSPSSTPMRLPEGTKKTVCDGLSPDALKKRLLVAAETMSKDRTCNDYPLKSDEPPSHILIDHPCPEISELAQILFDLETELISTGLAKVRWPDNVTWMNYLDYLIVPSLVYELEFPRTDKIRPFYVFEKTVATLGTFALLYTVTAHSIIPMIPTREQFFLRSLLDLSLPFMLSYLLLFYIIFECICNGFAELSRFADRQFYEDWWNSTSWDEFARKWNRPVYLFLLRHVYASTLTTNRVSRGMATFLTFLLSAVVHEVVMVIVTKKFRMYLFIMQMGQLPLIALGRLPAIKRNKILGNIVFWLGLYVGFPMLCVAYCTY